MDGNKFKINIYPYTVESDKEVNYVGLTLQIAYSDNYPETTPEINVFALKGLGKKECDELKAKLDQLAQESIGAVMVFTLVSFAQEWLLEHNDHKTEQQIEMVKQESAAYEEQEEESEYEKLMKEKSMSLSRYTLNSEVNPQFISKGTPVTVEIFLQWKAQFDKERAEVKEKLRQMAEQQAEEVLPGKLTGREIFEKKSSWFAEKAGITGETNQAEGVDIDDDLFLDDEEGYE
jgi:hypothetical protein